MSPTDININNNDMAVARELADHNARLKAMEEEVAEMSKDIREIRDTITGAKGSWKMLVAIVSLLSGVISVVAGKMWSLFVSSGS